MGVEGGEAAGGNLGVEELEAADGTRGGGGVGEPLVAGWQVPGKGT